MATNLTFKRLLATISKHVFFVDYSSLKTGTDFTLERLFTIVNNHELYSTNALYESIITDCACKRFITTMNKCIPSKTTSY